jgi:HYR domain/RTX calcium-binding nonapeptide repeat (4 copies)
MKMNKKNIFPVQGVVIAALLMSLAWLTPAAIITPQAAFATPSVTCDGETATIVGTSGNNDIVGTSGDDVIAALAGNDIVSGGGGDDLICGGSGNDQINGGDGNDRIIGESGDDEMNGDSGTDQLVGNAGVDRANGGAGSDICNAETETSCDEPADTTAPVIAVPEEDITEEATSTEGAVVTFEVSAEDDVDGQVEVSCTPESGSTFPIGTTTVTCTAADEAGNEATETFTVTITPLPDTTPPTLDVPDDMRVFFTGDVTSGVITWEVTAQDNVDGTATLEEDNTVTQDDVGGDITMGCSPPSGTTFSRGVVYTIRCTATDEAGNTATASFTIDTRL